jgi:hypothetical protein
VREILSDECSEETDEDDDAIEEVESKENMAKRRRRMQKGREYHMTGVCSLLALL